MSAARPGRLGSLDAVPRPWPPESTPAPAPTSAWVSREVDAMAAAWSRGQRVSAAEIIDRHPGIADEAAVRLIYEEVNLRREAGEDVPTTEVVGRYPRWRDELEVLLGCDRLLRPLDRRGRPARGRRAPRAVLSCGRSSAGAPPARPTWPPSPRWRTGRSS